MTIYEKLIKVQNELKAPKSQYNNFGKYAYRNCEDIQEALKPILLKNKCVCFLTDEIINIENRFYIKAICTFVDVETGDKIQNSAFAREEETKKGMDASQITGGTSSYARKYALNGMFAIDDTKDSDSTNNHCKDNSSTNNYNKKESVSSKFELNEAQIKRLYTIASTKGLSHEKVKEQMYKRFKKTSAKELTKSEYDKMCEGYSNL